jgi:glyoxylase-like metal-dependent hydrolase (beta-lactamase superfamily II)
MSAERPLPPAEQIAEGLWSLPVPLPGSPLRYTLAYGLVIPDGVVLVDTGLGLDEGLDALRDGLALAGRTLEQVTGIIVTHIHVDHYGLAGRVRDLSGCWIGLHPDDATYIPDRYEAIDEGLAAVGDWLASCDAPEDEVQELRDATVGLRDLVSVAQPDRLIRDGERIELPGWELTAIHTPGHTPGHLCLHEGRTDAVLTGDHVLPRITPNVSKNPLSLDNPLGAFLDSLDKLRPYGDALTLPAHEWRFTGLGSRLDELAGHHTKRLDAVEALVASGAETVWEVSAGLEWSRSWSSLHGFMRRLALGETHAHLELLAQTGRLRQVADAPLRWQTPTRG